MMAQKVNLQSIASAAGVSVSTASRVLNHSRGSFPIAEKTREKVLRIAREQGYLLSGAGRALKQGRMNTVGIVETSSSVFVELGVSLQHYLFLNEALRGIYRAAVKRDYHVMLMTGADRTFENEIELLGRMGMVDGLLVTNRDLASEPVFEEAMRVYPKPVVYALDYPDFTEACWVAPDDRHGGQLATRTLIERGHRKILFARMRGFDNIFQKRADGWRKAMKSEKKFKVEGQQVEAEFADFPELVRQGYSAVVCANLPTADLVEKSLGTARLRMPDDMELIAFSSDVAAVLEPLVANNKWAVVSEPLARIMEAGCNLLVDLIENKEPKKRQLLFPFAINYGRSCPQQRGEFGRFALQMH